jgi:hypothetical protein
MMASARRWRAIAKASVSRRSLQSRRMLKSAQEGLTLCEEYHRQFGLNRKQCPKEKLLAALIIGCSLPSDIS